MVFPAPRRFAWAAVLAGCVGGNLLMLGLLTMAKAFFIAVTTCVATVVFYLQPLQQRLPAVI